MRVGEARGAVAPGTATLLLAARGCMPSIASAGAAGSSAACGTSLMWGVQFLLLLVYPESLTVCPSCKWSLSHHKAARLE